MSWRLPQEFEPPPFDVAPDLRGAKLGPRLASLAEAVPDSARLADVGTDHGLLPVAMVKSGRVERAIGLDVKAQPLLGAERNRRLAGVHERCELRCGDGLAPLRSGEVDTLVIAGMGGPTIAEILAARPPAQLGIDRIIIQPFKGASHARRALMQAGFRIDDEQFVCEGGRFFLNIIAKDGTTTYADDDLFLGPRLRAARPPLYETWLRIQREWLEEQLAGQADAPEQGTEARYRWVMDALNEAA